MNHPLLDDGDLAKIEIRLYYVNMRQTKKHTNKTNS